MANSMKLEGKTREMTVTSPSRIRATRQQLRTAALVSICVLVAFRGSSWNASSGLSTSMSESGTSSSSTKLVESLLRRCQARNEFELSPNSCAPSKSMKRFDEIYRTGYWKGRIKDQGGFGPMLAKEDFYSNADWPPKPRVSSSGVGSDLGNATKTSMKVLRQAIMQYNVSTMIDLPCGDANWIFDSWETDSLKLYIGLDVVPEVIERNRERLSHHRNKIFRLWDGVNCALPKYKDCQTQASASVAADLVHSRDVIQHLTPAQGISFLCNVLTSGARVFVATSFPVEQNKRVRTGDFAHINLHRSPYDLPRGDCVPTHPYMEPDETCVYNLSGSWVRRWMKRTGCLSINT